MLATAVDAPKTKALKNGAKVAVSLISDSKASKVLLIRGTVRTDTVEGIGRQPPRREQRGGTGRTCQELCAHANDAHGLGCPVRNDSIRDVKGVPAWNKNACPASG